MDTVAESTYWQRFPYGPLAKKRSGFYPGIEADDGRSGNEGPRRMEMGGKEQEGV